MQQRNQHPKVRNSPLSPIEQFLVDKANIEAMCREQEKKLGEDFAYIRDNAPELLLSGILSLLFSSEKKTDTAANGRSKRDELTDPFIASDYLAIARSLLPVVRSIIQPMLITWGINKAISLISGLFSGNKKVSSRN